MSTAPVELNRPGAIDDDGKVNFILANVASMAPRIQFHDHPSAHASNPNLTDLARTNQDIDVIEGSPVEYRHQRPNLYLSPIDINVSIYTCPQLRSHFEISNEMSETFQLLGIRHGLNTNSDVSCY